MEIVRPSVAAMRDQKSAQFRIMVSKNEIGFCPQGTEYFRQGARWGLVTQKYNGIGLSAGGSDVRKFAVRVAAKKDSGHVVVVPARLVV